MWLCKVSGMFWSSWGLVTAVTLRGADTGKRWSVENLKFCFEEKPGYGDQTLKVQITDKAKLQCII